MRFAATVVVIADGAIWGSSPSLAIMMSEIGYLLLPSRGVTSIQIPLKNKMNLYQGINDHYGCYKIFRKQI